MSTSEQKLERLARSAARFLFWPALMLTMLLTCWHPSVVFAADGDHQLEAQSLANFPEFTDWPTNAFTNNVDPLVIGIWGKDPFGQALDDAVRNRQAHNRQLVVKRLKKMDDVKNCQVLYVSDSETKKLPRILSTLKGKSVLTVGDMPDFASRGGMVRLVSHTNEIQLHVNLDELNAAGLTLSSKLLRTAEIEPTAKK